MDSKTSKRLSDRIEFLADKLTDESGKMFVRIEIPVREKGFAHNFFVHFRKKGTIQWQSSPLIRKSNFIDMHGLDDDSVYEIRVAVLSPPQDVSTSGDRAQIKGDNLIANINSSNKEKYLTLNSLDIEVIEKFAIDLTEQVINEALRIVNSRSEQNI